jgi:hypothetical protein
MAYNDVNDTKELAKEKATEVAQTAQSAAGDVATTAKQQAQAFTDEAKYHARQLFGTTRQQLSEQAEQRTQEASKGLHRLADQMQALGEGRPQDAGPASSRRDSGSGPPAWTRAGSTAQPVISRASPAAGRWSSSVGAWPPGWSSDGW